jgi:DNA-directed RNA polymerase specialized sigma24 family protein
LEGVFGRHGQDVFRLCCALAGAKDGEELFSRTIGRVVERFKSGVGNQDLKPWLFAQAQAEATDSGSLAVAAARATTPVEAEPSDAGQLLLERFEEMSRTERGSLVMRELSGLSYGAIADVLGISSGSARRVVAEARLAMVQTVPGPTAECEVVRQALVADHLTPLAQSGVDRHLERCPYCSHVNRGVGALPALLQKALPRISRAVILAMLKEQLAHASAGQSSEKQAREREARARAKRAYRRRRSIAAGAVLALLVVVAALAVSTGRINPDRATSGSGGVLPFAFTAPALQNLELGLSDSSKPKPKPKPRPRPGPCVAGTPNCPNPTPGPCVVGTPNCPNPTPGPCVVGTPNCPNPTPGPCVVGTPNCPSGCPPGTHGTPPKCVRDCRSPRLGPGCRCPAGTDEPDCKPKPELCPDGTPKPPDGICNLKPPSDLCPPHRDHHHGRPEPEPTPPPEPEQPQPDPAPQPAPPPEPVAHPDPPPDPEPAPPPQPAPDPTPEPVPQPMPEDERAPTEAPPQPSDEERDEPSDDHRDHGQDGMQPQWAVDPQRRRRERKRWVLH